MVDKLIIAPGSDPDQFYATGLGLDTFITLIREKQTILAAGGFEYPQAAAKFKTERFEELGKTFPEVVAAFLKKYDVQTPLMSSSTQQKFAKLIPDATFTNELFAQRAIKNKSEINAIKKTQKTTEKAILAVRDTLAASKIKKGIAYYKGKILTSEQLKAIAAIELAKENCICPEMIISSGKQSALPHHRGSGPIKEGAVVIDIFPQHNTLRYFADCTRTYVVGSAPKTFNERYAALLEVHKKIGKQIKHGVENIDKMSREILESRGFKTDFAKGSGYIHGLGHGVGLEIHETPRLREKLAAGNVITIEPGLYYDYGIRIEDIGLVTKNGFENFTKISKEPYL